MSGNRSIYRVDKFVVPQSSREEFLKRVFDTHHVLRRQPGFIRDAILEQTAGPGRFNFVTVVEWQSQEAVDAAHAAVTKAHAASAFDVQATMARLSIEPDIGYYKSIDG